MPVRIPAIDESNRFDELVMKALRADFGQVDHVSALTSPVYIGHRGAPRVYPELSLEAWEDCIRHGFAPEADLQMLKDGTLVNNHDATTGRTMFGPDTPLSEMTVTDWRARVIKPVYPGGKTGTPMTLDDILNQFAPRGLCVVELKAKGVISAAFIKAVKARGLEKAIIMQSFDYGSCMESGAAGIKTSFLYQGTPDPKWKTPAQFLADGISFLSLTAAADPVYVRTMRAGGVPTFTWTINTPKEADALLRAGSFGIITDDPKGISRRFNVARREDFTGGYGWPMNQTINGGQFYFDVINPGLGFKYGGTGVNPAIRLGQFGKGPTNGRYRFKVQFKPGADNDSRSFQFFVGSMTEDVPYQDTNVGGPSGFNVVIRRNGQRSVWRRVGNDLAEMAPAIVAAEAFKSTDSSTSGPVMEFELEITDSAINLRGITDGTSWTVANSELRNPEAVLTARAAATGCILSDVRVDRDQSMSVPG